MTSKHELSDAEAALQIARNLEKKGYIVKNIKEIEREIAWLREKGYVK